jgi:predicted ATPase/DNA-binding CsgD family transcriptional regulator
MSLAAAHTLPALPPTTLVGRAVELATIVRRLTHKQARLLTLTGPAGVGKTRLALEAAELLATELTDGVILVDLAPVPSPPFVMSAIARSLGLTDVGARPLADRVQEYLQGRALLLILDNFEHVLPAASQLPELLAAAPGLRLLVTSRVPLRLRWEQTLRLSPLVVPDPNARLSLEELMQIPSVALFVERAQAQRADFLPTAQQAPLLTRLACQLDGLPLAIELAAANMQALPLPVIARRLDQHLETLRWDAHDLPERQRSLQAAIGWSYELLPPTEQRLFRHLGVFAGRVALAAMAGMLVQDEEETLIGLIALTQKSLLLPVPLTEEDADPAFGMLETVREYAREQLAAAGELEAAAGAHATYFLALAEEAKPRLWGPEQAHLLAELEREHDNLRGALGWLREQGGGELGLRLASALELLWERRGHLSEGRTWVESMLRVGAAAPSRVRAAALDTAGWLAYRQADYGRAEALYEEAVALWHELGNRDGIARSLRGLGATVSRRGDFGRAEALLQEALELWRVLNDQTNIAGALMNLGALAYWRGDDERAEALLQEALTLERELGVQGRLAYVLLYLGRAACRRGDGVAAVAHYQEMIQLCRATGDSYLLPYALEACGWVTRDGGESESAVRLYGAAAAVRASTHAVLAPHEATDLEHQIGALRETLGAAAFEREWAAGQRMPAGEAVALALKLLEEAEQSPAGGESETTEPAAASPLSSREKDVIRLIAQGLTSKQIAQQLFLSPRTVDHHVTSICNKLGVETRAQAASVATREGMV